MYNSYNENSDEDKLPTLCNYLILIENDGHDEIIPCTSITKTIKIASLEQKFCRIFERAGSLGKNWTYLCDISKGVI